MLCTEGMVRATINLLEIVIRKNDFIVVLPNSFIQIHEVSSDTRISFAGFSSDFMLSGNYVEILLDFMPMILNSPVISLQEDVAGLYRNVYLLLIRAYTLPHSLENKEIIRSVLAIFLQGTKELYKRYGKKLDEPLRREQELYRQFIQLLMVHYTKEHEVAFLCGEVWGYCGTFLKCHPSGKRIQSVGNHYRNYYYECEGPIENHPVAGEGNSFLVRL